MNLLCGRCEVGAHRSSCVRGFSCIAPQDFSPFTALRMLNRLWSTSYDNFCEEVYCRNPCMSWRAKGARKKGKVSSAKSVKPAACSTGDQPVVKIPDINEVSLLVTRRSFCLRLSYIDKTFSGERWGFSTQSRKQCARVAASRRPKFKPWPATGCKVWAALPIATHRPVTGWGLRLW